MLGLSSVTVLTLLGLEVPSQSSSVTRDAIELPVSWLTRAEIRRKLGLLDAASPAVAQETSQAVCPEQPVPVLMIVGLAAFALAANTAARNSARTTTSPARRPVLEIGLSAVPVRASLLMRD